MRLYVGSGYYDRTMRKSGWGKLFGIGYTRQSDFWELWIALFGREFWFGRTPPGAA